MIITDIKEYDGSLIHSRFAYQFFRENTLPIGNIVAFRAPMKVEVDGMIDKEDVIKNEFIYSADALNFCWEIPNLDPFGAVAFQRLFNTLIGETLQKYFDFRADLDDSIGVDVDSIKQKRVYMDGDDIRVLDNFERKGVTHTSGKASVSITYSTNNVAIGHTGINVDAGDDAPGFAYSTGFFENEANDFMQDVVDLFYGLCEDIFLATTKLTVA